MRSTNRVMGSRSAGIRTRMRWSRIVKLEAEVSSSISNAEAPASTASTREAAWGGEPEAVGVEKLRGEVPEGRPLMKGERATPATGRRARARRGWAYGRETT